MPKITYKIPQVDKKGVYREVDAQGTVVWMHIGPKRIKFVLQDGDNSLVHWASGMIAVPGRKIGEMRLMVSVQNRVDLPLRRAAERVMANILNEVGHEVVLDKIEKAKVINV